MYETAIVHTADYGGRQDELRKGYTGVRYHVVDGRMPCAIAVITKA